MPQVLAGYEQAVRLAALLRLEAICEALVAGLAEAAGMGGAALAPHSSSAEAKQVAALSKLVALGSCSEAGMLGSPSWLILLRTLSTLERLQATLLPGTKDGLPPLPEGSAAAMATSLDAAAAAAAAAAAMPVQLAPPPQPSSSFGRLLQRMGFSSGSEPTAGSTASGSSGGGAGGRSGLLAIKDAPGAGHVMWAETAGERAGELPGKRRQACSFLASCRCRCLPRRAAALRCLIPCLPLPPNCLALVPSAPRLLRSPVEACSPAASLRGARRPRPTCASPCSACRPACDCRRCRRRRAPVQQQRRAARGRCAGVHARAVRCLPGRAAPTGTR